MVAQTQKILIMKQFLVVLFLYIGGFILWIFNVLIPYWSKILIHIQNHCNLNTTLDLLYCAKQLLLWFMWTSILTICMWLITIFIVTRN